VKLPIILLSKRTCAALRPPFERKGGQYPLSGVHGVTLRDKVRSQEIRKALNVEPLLRIERSQVRYSFGHLSGMPRKRLARLVLLGTPTRERPRGRPRTRWSDYISDLVWSRFGVVPAELSEIAVGHEVSGVLLGVLLP